MSSLPCLEFANPRHIDVPERQAHRDRRPQPNLTLYVELTAMEVDDLLDDSQPQSCPATTVPTIGISFVERLRNVS